ncbi:MAG: helix-turn-helix transcriptional regulator [Desulfosporosinus sp.]|nr:helix-turn-helix transcriptional regulator [Desulfosporosinus sp.]
MNKINLKTLKSLRKKAGLTQVEVATYLGYQTSLGYHYIESGRCNLSAEHAVILSKLYNVQIENFFVSEITMKVTAENNPKPKLIEAKGG